MNSIWDQSVAGHKHMIRQYIIDALLDMISERGESKVAMSQLAKAAKVSRQTLYNYYPDVESVLVAWMEQEADMLYHDIREKTAGLADPLEQLFVYVVTSLQACADRQHPTGVEAAMSMQAAVSSELRIRIAEHTSSLEEHLRHILERGVLERKFRQDLDIDAQTRLIFRLTASLHNVMADPRYNVERTTKAIMDLVMNRLTA